MHFLTHNKVISSIILIIGVVLASYFVVFRNPTEPQTTDSNPTQNLPVEIKTDSVFNTWFKQKQADFSPANITSFSNKEILTLKTNSPYTYDEWQTCHGVKTINSPDATKIICISSGDEPDSSLILINKTKKESVLIEFCGTPCKYEDGFWLDNDKFVFLKTVFDVDYSDTNFGFNELIIEEFDFSKNTILKWTSNKVKVKNV